MKHYHVTYYYLATGMEGRADVEDFGMVVADNEKQAKYNAARERYPNMSRSDIDWTVGCLTAREVSS